MAGLGFKDFQVGEVLTSSDVDGYLMQQTVMRFADAGARGSALGTASGTSVALAEGMVSYLDDANTVQVYSGSAWVGIGNFSASTAITTTDASWAVPTLADPIVRVTVVGGGGGGASIRNEGSAGSSSSFACAAGTVTAAGGDGGIRMESDSAGVTAQTGFVTANFGYSATDIVNDGGEVVGYMGNHGRGGIVTVGYLNLAGIGTATVTVGAGGAGGAAAPFDTAGSGGGNGVVIFEYRAV